MGTCVARRQGIVPEDKEATFLSFVQKDTRDAVIDYFNLILGHGPVIPAPFSRSPQSDCRAVYRILTVSGTPCGYGCRRSSKLQ